MGEKGLVFPLSPSLFTCLHFLDQYYPAYLTNLIGLLGPQLSLVLMSVCVCVGEDYQLSAS